MKPAAVALLLLAVTPPTPSSGLKNGPLVLAVSGGIHIEAAPAWAVVPRSWLATGDTLLLDQDARLVLVYRSGRRFETRGAGRVRIGSKAPSGPGVRELPNLPAWPVRLQAEELRGTRPGGLRVRAGRIEGLRPGDGGTLLADEAWLSFTPEAGVSSYAVEVSDRHGRSVFATRTDATALQVPPGRLQAGAAYYWTVETLDTAGPGAQGEAAFRTLSAQEAAEYESTRGRLQGTAEAEARIYLSAIDASLGLPDRP